MRLKLAIAFVLAGASMALIIGAIAGYFSEIAVKDQADDAASLFIMLLVAYLAGFFGFGYSVALMLEQVRTILSPFREVGSDASPAGKVVEAKNPPGAG